MCVYDNTTPPSGKVIGANRTTALTGSLSAVIVVGVGVGVITINYYGFVQVSGVHTNVLSTSTTIQRWQIASGTNDTCTDAPATLTSASLIFGESLAATSGGRAQVKLRGLV